MIFFFFFCGDNETKNNKARGLLSFLIVHLITTLKTLMTKSKYSDIKNSSFNGSVMLAVRMKITIIPQTSGEIYD